MSNLKFLKYIILTASAICIAALFASCERIYVSEDNNPSAALREFCGYISDGDYPAAFELTGSAADVSASDLGSSIEGAFLSRLARSITVTPLSEPVVKGTSAWQSVRIVHVDMRLAIRKMLSGIMDETSAYEWKHGSYKTDEDISRAVYESLCSQLDGDLSDCMITERVRIQFRFRNGRWTPVMTKPLYDALTGYASEAADSIDDFFDGYTSEQS